MRGWDFRNAGPEQINLWRNASALIAWNTLTPIFYQGNIAGSEFELYAATKLYIGLEIKFDKSTPYTSPPTINLYNIFNSINFVVDNHNLNIGSTNYLVNTIELRNMYFSRIMTNFWVNMIFNGYKIEQI